jgi:O-antigen/teichoic acid export membrane protein
VLLPLMTRHLGAINYGIWAQVALIVGLVGPLVASGLDSASSRFFPSMEKEERRAQFSAVSAYMLLGSSIFAVVLWLASDFLAEVLLSDPDQAHFVTLAGLLTVTSFAVQIARLHLRISGQAKLYGVSNVVQSILNSVAIVVVVIRGGSITDVVTWTIGADAILGAGLLLYIVARGGFGLPRFSSLGYLLRFGVVLIPAGYAMVLVNWIDRVYLVHYRDLAVVGQYSVAYSLGYLAIAVIFNPIWVMFPTKAAELYSTDDMDEVVSLRSRSISVALLFIVPLTVGWAVLGKPIVDLIAGDGFVLGAHVIWIITAGYTLHMIGSYFDVGLGLRGKQRWSSVSMVLAVLVNLGLNWILIPRYGLAGAASATLIAFGTQATVSIIVHSRVGSVSFDFKPLIKILVATGIMVIPLLILGTDTPLKLFGVVGAGTGIYVVVVFLIKPLTFAQIRSNIGGNGSNIDDD